MNTQQANWDENGEAVFHRDCWTQLVQAAKATSAQKTVDLNELEVRLIKEAKKTAEYHDSDTFIKDEANRIVRMVKQAKYPIFFTGNLIHDKV